MVYSGTDLVAREVFEDAHSEFQFRLSRAPAPGGYHGGHAPGSGYGGGYGPDGRSAPGGYGPGYGY